MHSGQHVDDGLLLDMTEAKEDAAQPPLLLFLDAQSFLELGACYMPLFAKELSNADFSCARLIFDGRLKARSF